MSDFVRSVRPTPDALRALPTQETETPAEGVAWELKLVTDDAKYWLCTQGNGGESGRCSQFVAGRVIVEPRTPDPETGEAEMVDYGPENVRELQGVDYIDRLVGQIELLKRQQDKDFTHAHAKDIEEAQRDLKKALATLGLKPPLLNE
jgi:hypothetical protein